MTLQNERRKIVGLEPDRRSSFYGEITFRCGNSRETIWSTF
jgi:hypothetical protein